MKVALVGSAPASVALAPYSAPDWRIYGCSPGVYGIAPRIDEWFELHVWEPGQPWFSPEYVQWMKALPDRGATLWVGGPVPEIAKAQIYPFEQVLAKYDPKCWFATSSLFWMLARAMEAIQDEAAAQGRAVNPHDDKIGLFGVDMAAKSEYEMQRAGIHFMAYKAAALGIEVGTRKESDLFTPRFAYGRDEWTHSYVKLRARHAELSGRLAQAEAQAVAARETVAFLKGAVEDLEYCGDTWADKGEHLGIAPVFKTEAALSDLESQEVTVIAGAGQLPVQAGE